MNELLKGLDSKTIRSNADFYRLTPDTRALLEIESTLTQTVFGQDRAVKEIARAITRSMAGLGAPNRPSFSGLFLGEPGVGKTEAGRAIVNTFYAKNAEDHLLILDSANFNERHTTYKLTGSPPGYVGYGDKPLITPEFLFGPNVIVVDEIEKGCKEWHETWLGILDRGKLSAPIGRTTYREVENVTLNFANSLIIFTSNIGSAELRKAKIGGGGMGFGAEKRKLSDVGLTAFKDYFKSMPEFPNRLDSVIVFDNLSDEVYPKLVDKFVEEYNVPSYFNNYFALTKEAKDFVISKTNKQFGGRELRRTLEKEIITKVAEVKFNLPHGVPFVVDVEDGQVICWASHLIDEQLKEEELKKKQTTPIQLPEERKTKEDGTPSNIVVLYPGKEHWEMEWLTPEQLEQDTKELKKFLERIKK